jgi:hypothetical protein
MNDPLEGLARHVAADPFFLAPLLAEFARGEWLDDEALAVRLGCRREDLAALRLCRAPRPDPDGFREDVECIAGHFRLDVDQLIEAVRRGQVLQRLRKVAGASGSMLAARDRPPGEQS